ncbi:MAG: alpha-galactosidase [Chloroflexi bacterium]|nr:alpha-galactosidase [Chloroflexota bacterium]
MSKSTFSKISAVLSLFFLLVLGLLLSPQATKAQTPTPTPDLPAGNIIARSGDAYVAFDSATQVWEIGTDGIRRRMDYDANVGYRVISLKNKLTNREWLATGSTTSAELRMRIDGQEVTGAASDFIFQNYSVRQQTNGALELIVSFQRLTLTVHLHYVVYPKTNVIEQWAVLENSGFTTVKSLTALDSISLALRPSPDPLTLYWVQGVSPSPTDLKRAQPVPNLRLRSVRLNERVGQTIESLARSSEESMGWFALVSPSLRDGLFGGIEWSGAWQLRAERLSGQTTLRAGLDHIYLDLEPRQTFESPRRFLGFFRGGVEDAAFASHTFARNYLLREHPANFPWTQFNTWFAYYTDIDEERLRRDVDNAAAMGLEAFVIDAGWYEGSPRIADFSFGLGTWRENREKFPSGLAAFSDYVHSKGMKFGLWVEPERVDMDYVLNKREIPVEWLAPGADQPRELPEGAAWAAQVCLGNPKARAWIKDWLSRIIRDYQVDWLKWDNNIWMSCDPPDQPGHGNYDHIKGLYEILDYLRVEFPNLIIENCASGGNRMDYALMRRTDIAWLSDETDPSYRVRYHAFGASYVFPPEYLNSFIVESWFEHLEIARNDPAILRGWLRSRMLGAFGISTSTVEWDKDFRDAVALEIHRYKSVRDIMAHGREFRLLPQSDLSLPLLEPPTEPEAIEFFDAITRRGVVFLFKGAVPWTQRRVVLQGLSANTVYDVRSADGIINVRQTGRVLMTQSMSFSYEQEHPSTMLFIQPAPTGALPDPTPKP